MGHPEGVGQGDDIVSPINGTNLIPGIIKCNENGVKGINLGPGVDEAALEEAGGYLDAKITVDFKTVANHIIARLPEGGQVAILAGLTGAGQSEGPYCRRQRDSRSCRRNRAYGYSKLRLQRQPGL